MVNDKDALKTLHFDLSREDIPWENGQEMHDIWHKYAASSDTGLPYRKDVPLRELGPYLPTVALVKVQRDPYAFPITVAGTALDNFFGRNLAGTGMEDLPSGDNACIRAIEVLRVKKPGLIVSPPALENRKHRTDSMLVLPFTNDGDTVHWLWYQMHFGE